jgi:hypothetical protein
MTRKRGFMGFQVSRPFVVSSDGLYRLCKLGAGDSNQSKDMSSRKRGREERR